MKGHGHALCGVTQTMQPRAQQRRVRRCAQLPPRRPHESRGVEEGCAGLCRRARRPRQPRRPVHPAPAALAGPRALRRDRSGGPALAPDRLGADGRAHGAGLWPAPARPRDRSRPGPGTPGALPGGTGAVLTNVLPSRGVVLLPRDTRDTLFLLAVIAWVVALQAAHIPPWTTALTGAVLAWRGWLALKAQPLPGWPWRAALLVIALTLNRLRLRKSNHSTSLISISCFCCAR